MTHRAPNLDYTTEHTGADPEHVRTETEVDNEDKRLPTDDHKVTLLSALAALLAVVGLVLSFFADWDLVGTIVALAGLITAAVALIMAMGDERAGSVLPAVTTLVTGILLVVCVVDLFDTEDAVEDIQRDGVGVVTPAAGSEATDGDADLGATGEVD